MTNGDGKFRTNNYLGARKAGTTPVMVMEILEKYNVGRTQGSLAREYGLSVGTIGRMVRGETWQALRRKTDNEVQVETINRRIDAGADALPVLDVAGSLAKLQQQLSMPNAMEAAMMHLTPEQQAKAEFYLNGRAENGDIAKVESGAPQATEAGFADLPGEGEIEGEERVDTGERTDGEGG